MRRLALVKLKSSRSDAHKTFMRRRTSMQFNLWLDTCNVMPGMLLCFCDKKCSCFSSLERVFVLFCKDQALNFLTFVTGAR